MVKQVCKLSNNCVLPRFELELELGFITQHILPPRVLILGRGQACLRTHGKYLSKVSVLVDLRKDKK